VDTSAVLASLEDRVIDEAVAALAGEQLVAFLARDRPRSIPAPGAGSPNWRPKPRTSLTVRPCTRWSTSASISSSSFSGLMMAVISFIG
jgi:hypothetical protein